MVFFKRSRKSTTIHRVPNSIKVLTSFTRDSRLERVSLHPSEIKHPRSCKLISSFFQAPWLRDVYPNGQRTACSTSRFWSQSANAALEVQVLSVLSISEDVAYLHCIAINFGKRNSSAASDVGKKDDDGNLGKMHCWWLERFSVVILLLGIDENVRHSAFIFSLSYPDPYHRSRLSYETW